MASVKVEQLGNEIKKVLEEFEGTLDVDIEEALEKTSKYAVNELRNANPSGSGKYHSWKDYNKGWKVTKNLKRRQKTATIHNTKYQLTHLLEKGHAVTSKKGGRTTTRAFVHIEPVAKEAEDMFFEEIKKGIRQ